MSAQSVPESADAVETILAVVELGTQAVITAVAVSAAELTFESFAAVAVAAAVFAVEASVAVAETFVVAVVITVAVTFVAAV